MLRRQRGKNILFLWVKTSVKTLPSKPSRQDHSTWSSAPSVTGWGWNGSPRLRHIRSPSPLARSTAGPPAEHLPMEILPGATAPCTAGALELRCSRPFLLTQRHLNKTTNPLYVTMTHHSSLGLAFCFFEKSWHWTDITDETWSDQGAQMRMRLKESSYCKKSKASGNYLHTSKKYIFK